MNNTKTSIDDCQKYFIALGFLNSIFSLHNKYSPYHKLLFVTLLAIALTTRSNNIDYGIKQTHRCRKLNWH